MLFVQVYAMCVSAVFVFDLADCPLCMEITFKDTPKDNAAATQVEWRA